MADACDVAKREAGRAGADRIPDGARVGLGTGSTVEHTLVRLAERIRDGLEVRGVPTSGATEQRARELGIPLVALEDVDELDVTIDGADEIDPRGNLIKGGGGALTRERIVAAASRRLIVVAGENKLVDRLGATFPLPIEVLEFGWRQAVRHLAALELEARLRVDAHGEPTRTDSGHWILDAALGPVVDLDGLAGRVRSVPGVVDCGLFVGMADTVLVADDDGRVREVRPTPDA